MDDLFGGATQASLFGDTPDRMTHAEATESLLPDEEDVRRRLRAVLATARTAERMPWEPRKARMWRTVFPQMANWLPKEEADDLRLAFAREIERLEEA